MKQNKPCYLFGMYEPDTNSVIVNALNNTYTCTPLTISCKKCNSSVLLDTPDDIAYLYRLAQESPLLYAELACGRIIITEQYISNSGSCRST